MDGISSKNKIGAVRATFRYVVVRGARVFVGVPCEWTGHDDDDVRHVIEGALYADVTSALDYLVTDDDPCDVGSSSRCWNSSSRRTRRGTAAA